MRLQCSPARPATAVRAALIEAGAPYELVRTDDPGPAAGARSQRLPALVDGDARVDGDAAIILWLGDRYPDSPLTPAPATPQRADCFRWVAYLANTVQTIGARRGTVVGVEPDIAATIRVGAASDLAGALEFIERELAHRDHLVAGRFTGADLLLYQLVAIELADLVPSVAAHPNLSAHRTRIEARPSVVGARAEWATSS